MPRTALAVARESSDWGPLQQTARMAMPAALDWRRAEATPAAPASD